MPLTPNDLLNKQFATTRLQEGYDQDEVDDFLDQVLAEFQRLIAENENLKTQLAAAPVAAAADSGELDAVRGQLAAAQQQVAQLQAQLEQSKEEAQSGAFDGMNSAEYLQLARRVHEEHVREGVVKRDQLIADGEAQSAALTAEAQSKADALVIAAQSRASSLINEAQAAADAMVQEAEDNADELAEEVRQRFDSQVSALTEQVSSLTASKSALEQSVADLKDFERTYRDSLRSHLEAQLGELDAIGADRGPSRVASALESTTGEVPSTSAALDEETSRTDSLDVSAEAPEPPVPGLGEQTGEQPSGFGY